MENIDIVYVGTVFGAMLKVFCCRFVAGFIFVVTWFFVMRYIDRNYVKT